VSCFLEEDKRSCTASLYFAKIRGCMYAG